MGIIKKIIKWNPFKTKSSTVLHSLADEELLRTKGINESLKKNIEYLNKRTVTAEQQVSEIKAQLTDQKEQEKLEKQELDNTIAEKLNKDKKNFDKERYGDFISFTDIERARFRSEKFNKNFILSDKDGISVWNKFRFGFFTKGYIGFMDSNKKIIHLSSDLRGLIHKPESLLSQIRMGRILLARDENGDYIDGIDDTYDDTINDIEIEVPIWDEVNKDYVNTKFTSEKFRKLYIELQDKIREIKDKYHTMELVVGDLRSDNSDFKQTINVLKHLEQKSKTALSDALMMMGSSSIETAEMTKKFASLTEKNTFLELELSGCKEKIKNLLDIIKETGDVTSYQKGMALLKQSIEFAKANQVVVEKEVQKQEVKQINQTK